MAKVLIGYSCCPLTRAAFEAAGCEAWTCDLLPARDGSKRHLQCDVWEVANDIWDAAVFHPMCTYLTVSAAWAFNDPDYARYPSVGYHQRVKPETKTGQARRDARDEAIDNFKRLMSLPYPKAAENPAKSFLCKAYRSPDCITQPFEHGDDASKETGFWLDRMPPIKPTGYREPRMVCRRCGSTWAYPAQDGCYACGVEQAFLAPRWSNQTDSGQNRVSPGEDRWLERSQTYPGIAAALGAQWGQWLTGER